MSTTLFPKGIPEIDAYLSSLDSRYGSRGRLDCLFQVCTTRGPLVACGKPCCGPQHPAKNVLILAQNWLLCGGSCWISAYLSLKLDIVTKIYGHISKMSSASCLPPAPLTRGFALAPYKGHRPQTELWPTTSVPDLFMALAFK